MNFINKCKHTNPCKNSAQMFLINAHMYKFYFLYVVHYYMWKLYTVFPDIWQQSIGNIYSFHFFTGMTLVVSFYSTQLPCSLLRGNPLILHNEIRVLSSQGKIIPMMSSVPHWLWSENNTSTTESNFCFQTGFVKFCMI